MKILPLIPKIVSIKCICGWDINNKNKLREIFETNIDRTKQLLRIYGKSLQVFSIDINSNKNISKRMSLYKAGMIISYFQPELYKNNYYVQIDFNNKNPENEYRVVRVLKGAGVEDNYYECVYVNQPDIKILNDIVKKIELKSL